MKRFLSIFSAAVMLLLCVSCGASSDDGWTAIGGNGSIAIDENWFDKTESQEPTVLDEIAFKDGIAVFDMTPYSSEKHALRNPDKGWYIHYYDNELDRYGAGLTPEKALEILPCLDHIYLRLAWGYLEPEEGKFDWNVIDKVIEPYVAAGVGISFRISCKETGDLYYATPEWVKDAGAKGTDMGNSWEPDYGDPIFLEKLENFHKAFAERYAGKDYVRYVDVGSYGDWGEGHTASSSKRDWDWSVIKQHFDIYDKYYKNTQIVISDDFVGSRVVQEGKEEIKRYVLDHGWTYRDDSICVNYFVKSIGYDTVRSPELFESVWRDVPVVLELDHYSKTIKYNDWHNGDTFYLAAVNTHSTYAGFHGYTDEWVKDNPEFAVKMGNKLGYWYFVDSVKLTQSSISIELQNKGMSKAYNRYELDLVFTDESGKDIVFSLSDFDNTLIMPNEKTAFEHEVDIKSLQSGKYIVSLRMHKGDRPVYFAVNKGHTGEDGRCILGNLTL